jgi:hypothetical protein
MKPAEPNSAALDFRDLDPANNHVTPELVDGLRHFERPTLLLCGEEGPHFRRKWGERLRSDIPSLSEALAWPAHAIDPSRAARLRSSASVC